MPHVVTQACCGDASCVYACPVNCIHPTPDEPDFGIAEMLYIDPSSCVDCGACVAACPVGAIVPGHRLPEGQERFADVNADAYTDGIMDLGLTAARFPVNPASRRPLAPVGHPERIKVEGPVSIGIIGSGPSAMYAADELLRQPDVSVTMYERLDRPFGLARFGVAPDHKATRSVMKFFDTIARDERLEILLNTEIGRDLQLRDLQDRHHALIWAGGAKTDRRLEIPGIDSTGVLSATSFVGWYNGHPDFANQSIDLCVQNAVIVGNGNVALDVARIIVTDPDKLAATSIAPYALTGLRTSTIERVTILGRRGPQFAAFTLPELIGLVDGGTPITVDPADLDGIDIAAIEDPTNRQKLQVLAEIAERPTPSVPHIKLAFGHPPVEVVAGATGRAEGLVVGTNGSTEETITLDAGLVMTSIGYHGVAVEGLPFDTARGIIPNYNGRVMDDGEPVTGKYVTGWIKRGPNGFIGTNKTDSGETVASLFADLEAGKLPTPRRLGAPA